MSKTVEEILKANTIVFQGNVEGPISEVTTAMHEFAAQEVEAYKGRLKEAVKHTILNERSSDLLTGRAIYEIIDTVK